MPRYADASHCPDCAAALPAAPGRCPTCGLPLTGPLAAELLRTLRRADDLVVHLRESIPDLVGAPSAASYSPPSGRAAPAQQVPAFLPAPPASFAPHTPPAPRRTGLRAPSVPKILLGLGSLCLLVAAVIFLAVAWSFIGVGGRTGVLVAATMTTGALGVRLGRRGLRVGAESLTTVSLGLLVLDLVGAQNAGWFGALEGSGFTTLVGTALAVAGGGLVAGLQRGRRRLVAPQLSVVAGSVVAMVAVHDLTGLTTLVLVLEVLGCAAVVRAARGNGVPVVVGGLSAVGATGWVILVLHGLFEAIDVDGAASLRSLWAEGDGVALLAALLLALLPIAVLPARNAAWQTALAVFGVMLSFILVLPVLDNGPNQAALAWLGALAVWTAIVVVVRRGAAPAVLARTSIAVLVPLAQSTLVAAVVLGIFVSRALVNVLGVGQGLGRTFGQSAGVRLDPLAETGHPVLTIAFTLVLLVAARVTLPWRRFVPEGAALALGAAALVTLAQYAVPLWVVAAILVVLGLVTLGDALRRPGIGVLVETAVAAGLLAAGTIVALPSAGLTASALGAGLVAAVLVLLAARFQRGGLVVGLHVPLVVDRAAGAVIPLTGSGLVWATAYALETRLSWCALVVMAGAGVFAIALPRIEIELAATVATVVGAPTSIAAAADPSVALAIHLTLAGALVTATALVHRDRRVLAIPGGLLLAAATWVRLADLGVSAPEAYTLPMALVLLAVGIDRIRRDTMVSTTAALLPGLMLSTVPSLLWVLGGPVSLRALLLGAACLVLVLAGAQVRWSAPLVVGAAVGVLLVVRELAPYASQTPQWVVIGLAGTLLTVVGVTWEKRLQDVQLASGFLGRLR